MQIDIRKTEDGSHTLYNKELQEPYHSTKGAVQESMHVFIDAALSQKQQKQLRVFEMGFGTGLNALLTYRYAVQHNIEILYQSIEKYPVQKKTYTQLNYAEFLQDPSLEEVFIKLHESPRDKEHNIDEHFTLLKIIADAATYDYSELKADIIYFDAFAPEKQPELWSEDMFKKMYSMLNPGGILTTYSAKGDVRRAMKKAGFTVEKLPGPPGKWEMLRGLGF